MKFVLMFMAIVNTYIPNDPYALEWFVKANQTQQECELHGKLEEERFLKTKHAVGVTWKCVTVNLDPPA